MRFLNNEPTTLRAVVLRAGLTFVALAIWFWTQSLIGHRELPAARIGDAGHAATASLNAYLQTHLHAANVLLIVSSGSIDLLALFLLAEWVFGRSVRPFLGLVILLALRQIVQVFCALPSPPNQIWHYPGFPSLLVTYGVANDYFFSGHTAIAVFAATELARLKSNWLTVVAVLVVCFEIVTVLALRAHYTMDVFTGIVAALYVRRVAEQIAPVVERKLVAVGSKTD